MMGKSKKLRIKVRELREVKDELIKMSNDEEQRALYEMIGNKTGLTVNEIKKLREEH